MRPNRVIPLTDASGPSSSVSQGSREARGRLTAACALARWSWGGSGGRAGWEYRRRQPEGSLLYRAVQENLATLREEAAEMGRGLPRFVERDFSKYLECGVLAHGFARVRCEACKDELLVAFSCKGQGVCPSCNQAEVERLLEVVRHRVLRLLESRGAPIRLSVERPRSEA